MNQAEEFSKTVKQEGRNIKLYSMSVNKAETDFESVLAHSSYTMPPMPVVTFARPVDWQRPTTFRGLEMLDADYWLLQPMQDPNATQLHLSAQSIDDFDQEENLFRAWATQLTAKDGIEIVSETPKARLLRIADPSSLETAIEALISKHHWRREFVEANTKRRFNEEDVVAELALTPPSVENVNFEDRILLRTLSVIRHGDDVTVRFWWKPLSPELGSDWRLFSHSIDGEGNIKLNNEVPLKMRLPKQSGETVLYDQATIKKPVLNGAQRLAFGFFRLNQGTIALLTADRGTRDWDNRRVIVPIP